MSDQASNQPTDQEGGKVFFVSLGCPKNQVDSELMLGDLAAHDYKVVDSADDADVLVVNTCSFVEEARAESVETILDLAHVKREHNDTKKLVVTGCLPQRYEAELRSELPEVDLFLGTGDIDTIGRELGAITGRELPVRSSRKIGRPGYNYDAYSPRVQTTPAWTSYVKIAEGCSQVCAFCIIPRLRGGQRSRAIADVVTEVRRLADRGVVEINLIAQDLTHYGDDLKTSDANLSRLLTELVKIDGIHWIRLLYCYPHAFSDELIELIAHEPKIASYVDMPLQHIADPMLERMRRRFSEADTRSLCYKLRERVPELVFRTTFIVGHPGETQDEFERLYDFVKEMRFERMGAFKYSREDGTRSARMGEPVMGIVKDERHHRLMSLQKVISSEIHEEMIGTELDVLVEGVSDETDLLLQGRTYGQAPKIDGLTYINEGWAEPGTIARAEIVDAGDYDLVARLL